MSDPKSPAEQLAVLFPEPKVLRIADVDVVVREMPVRKLARFGELLAPVFARFPEGVDGYAMLNAAGSAVLEGVAHAVDQPVDWIGELPAREFQRLAQAVADANADFFASGVGQIVSGVMATLWTAAGAGLTPSASSSDTATKTPAATPSDK